MVDNDTRQDTPTIAELQKALERVANSIHHFDQASRAWSSYHQGGHNAITGYAWHDFQQFNFEHVVSIRGLRGLKQAINKELSWLEKQASDAGSTDGPCVGSNAIYICTIWQRAINAAKSQGPLVALDATFPIPAVHDTPSASRQQKKPAKVDIVCESGKRWIRISTLKPIGLLSEFRNAESYVSNDDDSEDDESDTEGEQMNGSQTITEMNNRLAKDELDIAAKQSSIVKLINDLNTAASHLAKTSHYGRPAIELLLNRLPLAGITGIEGKFYDDQEKYRYEARLRAIIKYAKECNVEIITAEAEQSSALSAQSLTNFITDGGANELMQIPMPPKLQPSRGTKTLHLDLSALIAFVSHISHMPLPDRAENAEALFAKTHWREEDNDNITEDAEDTEVTNLEGENGEGRGQHSRALSDQLRREMTEDCFFDVLVRHLEDVDDEEPSDGYLHLTCTREARDKMAEIVSLVGGDNEKRRATCLFDQEGRAQDIWKSSRWSKDGDRENRVRSKIVLPVAVIEEDKVSKRQGTNTTTFDEQFVQIAKRSLSLGMQTFDSRSKSSHNAFAALRQTRHTIMSMMTALNHGQTLLTTNISSIKWLVRDMTRLQAHEGNLATYKTGKELDDRIHKAALWVMYPRSLSERMAVPENEISHGSRTLNSDDDIYPMLTPCEEISSKTDSKDASFHHQSIPILQDGHGMRNQSSTFEVRGRSNRFMRFARSFLLGPRPRAQLAIKHYPWWPLASVERGWQKITAPVAWKDPYHHKRNARQDVELAHGANSLQSGTHLSSKVAEEDGDPWWQGVKRDVRLNALHWCILALTLIGWVLGFSFLAKSLWYEGSVVSSDGAQSDTVFYGCTTSFWTANSQCGYNGESCAPFSASSPYNFRCPANCQTTVLGSPRAVGDQLPAWVPLVVGGSNVSSSIESSQAGTDSPYIYRGDSFVCAAAIHAGAIKKSKGGCGSAWLVGAYSGYEGVDRYGISSTPFNSTFPVSFYFDQGVHGEQCEDNRSHGYILNIILLAWIGFVLRPKQIVYFFTLVCVGFFHINFLSEPREYPMSVGDVFGDFLPTLFVAYALWRVNYRFTSQMLNKIPIEGTIWVQGFYWIGVMLDIVFVNVPLSRLVLSDIQDEPGALTSLIVIIVIVLVLAINQIRVIRKTGYLPKYLSMIIIGGILIGLLAAVPTTGLRLHHYIIALAIIPFCAFETRLSLIYSAFLLGVFLNGVGRWSYDGIIQDVAVIRGSATSGSTLPVFLAASNFVGVTPFNGTTPTVINTSSNLTQLSESMSGLVNWEPIPSNQTDQWDSYQLLIDDVLRLQSSQTYYDLGTLANNFIAFNGTGATSSLSSIELANTQSNFTFYPGGQDPSNILATLVSQPHYLRLAYYNSISGNLGDFTRAATVYFNGTFISPPDGAT
ncbi:uncharacterized protein FA14DRAFT_159997 [Meira miltonrushii]|uniref:LCCL domain-containing protein n=1 Tax=Meira miltonrushii TaxID=1280837 RepID=A0A316VLB7_9BASI|nr:uncharacterized protein FA14DRAFT_159997 [Meira miltonrushii]PWN38419.1 hypothetical protein FA14DRAFT_159997 [Meira miltonrushii]